MRAVYNCVMKIRYHTAKGSVYVQTKGPAGEYWVKESSDGVMQSLAGGVHIALPRLQELIDEYPRTLLDKTFCFNIGAEREFFEDAVREAYHGALGDEQTVIFFLVKAGDRYAVGCSSEVVRIEKEE